MAVLREPAQPIVSVESIDELNRQFGIRGVGSSFRQAVSYAKLAHRDARERLPIVKLDTPRSVQRS